LDNPGQYFNEIEKLKSVITINGTSEALIENAVKGLDLLKQDFISELSKDQKAID